MRNLLDLPDELLVKILSYVHHDLLLQLKELGSRFENVLSNKSLWKSISFSNPVSLKVLKGSLKYMGSHTNSLRVTGYLKGRRVLKSNLSGAFLNDIKMRCTNLQHISLQHILVDTKMCDFSLASLPGSLSELNVNHCEIPVNQSSDKYFSRSLSKLKNLRELRISNCSWLSLLDLVTCSDTLNLLKICFTNCGNFSVANHDWGLLHHKTSRFRRRNASKIDFSPLDLTLDNCRLTDSIIAQLGCVLVRVNRLCISNNTSVTNRGLSMITSRRREGNHDRQMLSLEYLNVSRTGVDSEGAEQTRMLIPTCDLVANHLTM